MKGGLADQFRNAHLSGDSVLHWDSQSDGAKPEFIPPPMMNQAVLTEAQMSVQDIKDVTNKHEASLGVTSNEVSGKAINARQRVSELGDRIYLENMNTAQAECARVINELIPEVYDSNRVVKLTGDDDLVLMQEINGLYGDETPDVTVGKYELTYTTGPSYATKRQESVETMLTLMNHMPQTGNYIADIIARNMDLPGSDEIAERLQGLLPPGMVDPERLPERARARFEQQQKAQQEQAEQNQQIQMGMLKKEVDKLSAEIAHIGAQAMKAEAQARLADSQAGVDRAKVVSQHQLGTANVELDAAKIGVDIDKNEISMAKIGVDAAAQAAQLTMKEAADGKKSGKEGDEKSPEGQRQE